MAKYSKAHERDESAKMWRGCWHSTFGILLCWVPVLGLALSISGLAHQVVRLTERYRGRMAALIVYALLSLMISIGAIMGGLYAYSRNLNMFNELAQWGWTKLTGQETLPGATTTSEYDRYGTGLGSFTDPSMIGGDEEPFPEEDEYIEDDEDYIELDFGWEVVEDSIETEGDKERVSYKLIIDEQNPKDEELLQLFEDVIYEDGYDLHTVLVYSAENETSGDYTIAGMVESISGAAPALERTNPHDESDDDGEELISEEDGEELQEEEDGAEVA